MRCLAACLSWWRRKLKCTSLVLEVGVTVSLLGCCLILRKTYTRGRNLDQLAEGTVDSSTMSTMSPDEEAAKVLPWWDGGYCQCDGDNCLPKASSRLESSHVVSSPEMPLAVTSGDVGGTCGRRAWAAGGGQRVVTFSLYGNNSEFWVGLDEILYQVKRRYPGWKVRLYTDPRDRGAILCPLLRRHHHFFVCDATTLPPPLGNLSLVLPSVWRIAPLGDPQVDAMMVRDLDSAITAREADAVKDWLSSEQVFHVMRDHRNHFVPVMAGLWGVKLNNDSRHQLAALRDTILAKAVGKSGYFDDQLLLASELFPAMEGKVMAHDSFWCGVYEDSLPWPTQRHNGIFVGYRKYKKVYHNETLREMCPRYCRPPDHPEWVFC
ncbi:uncharacterized protein [Procambarus clarkii]|uniref:uncharacterized protein n=1 Tax=Procambarus clarkii TaxID=6728 RepID=UPI003742DF9F